MTTTTTMDPKDPLHRFRHHRLPKPVYTPIDLTVTSSSALSPAPTPNARVAMQDLGFMTPMTSRSDGRYDIRPFPGKRVNKAQVTEADRMFKLKLVETCADQVMRAELKDMTYNPNSCRELSQVVAGQIMERIKSFSLTQYKLVCVVSIGSLKDRPAMQFGSRCLWNKDTDNFASVKFTNASIFAVAMIYGLYFD